MNYTELKRVANRQIKCNIPNSKLLSRINPSFINIQRGVTKFNSRIKTKDEERKIKAETKSSTDT